ncbi:formin-like protein 1-like [Dorcoceras hygrometricum]|uniref:Formin-like protein 1-like n=1 Tax=Dorcoceras hygrometricum TaxID=472368 RepID=A0A2Z7B5G8_9LAMI|nr:formin-like protein 1-like [Dorcoceras hygrometricum]
MSPSLNLGPSSSKLQMVVYIVNREENNRIDHKDDEGSTQAGPQQVFVSSPPANLNADIKVKEVEKFIVSLDSKVKFMDSKVLSLDSKVEELLNIQTFMKHDFSSYKSAFYEKMDMVAANVASSQKSLEIGLVRQFIEHQLQSASDIDFIKLQLEELVNHLKEIGDAKKG